MQQVSNVMYFDHFCKWLEKTANGEIHIKYLNFLEW